MKNLFDFATKELSQDAFLSWFIANCNDKTIGKHSYEFINFLTGFSFKYGDIKKIRIKQQEHDMDIVVDFWTSEKKDGQSHYVVVIEDKVMSSAHSGQLAKYNKRIDKWNNNEQGFVNRTKRVFYKVNHLTDKDEEELKKANNLWITKDIKDIYSFFSKIEDTGSEILDSYVAHIKKINDDLNTSSEKPMKEWNYTNFQTFFKKTINEEFSKQGWDYHYETWQYQGRLVSVAFYYHPNKSNMKLNKQVKGEYCCFAYPLIEFVFKKNAKNILVYSHITYHWYDGEKYKNDPDKWTWKHSRYEPCVDEAKSFMETLKSSLKSIPNIKIRKMKNERDQTISSEKIKLDKTNKEIEEEILKKLETYFEVFKGADTLFK